MQYGCYCPLCLADLSRRQGREFTRASLVEELRRDTWPEGNATQRAWDQRNHEAIKGVLRACERGAHEVVPGLELGLMTGMAERVEEWLDVLAGPDKAPIRFRPGAGFYVDDVPGGGIEKALRIGQIITHARPKRLTSIQCEIENFPYHKLQKSVQLNMVEAACYQATGCRGIAWNILPHERNPFDDYETRLAGIERWRPFFEQLAAWGGDLPASGLWLANSPDYHPGGYFGGLFGSSDPSGKASKTLRELGLPQAFCRAHACVTVLAGGAVSAFTPREVQQILSGGVIVDVEAAQWIQRMGLGRLLGVHLEPIYPGALRERLTNHPLNAPWGGQYRNAWLGFFALHGSGSGATRLDPLSPEVQVLTEMVHYYGTDSLGASVTAYENELGGRVVVLGYSPWERTHNSAKRGQLGRLAAWVSRDTVPAWSEV
ncbi:MAG: hypothetical protein WCI73_10065 [Phycisphaerae bacterium]